MSDLRIDDDVVQWAIDGRAASAEEALDALADRPLLLLMHGYGSFEGDLIGLAPRLPHGFVCASPRAPLVAPPPVVNGYSWWPLAIGDDGLPAKPEPVAEFLGTGPHTAALVMLEWLDALDSQLKSRGVEGGLGTVVPMGFSQGGCQVTSLLRLRPERFAAGVNCSGFVASGRFEGDAELARLRPPMFWGRDEADPIVGEDRVAMLTVWGAEHTDLEARLYEGIAHGIGLEELVDISVFLERHVPELAADGR